MGGVGFMSHKFGIQAGHVNEIELVSGLGDRLHCSKDVRSDLFNTVRGGLGNFGIVTSVHLPLVKAPSKIAIFKGFYTQEIGLQHFAEDMKSIVDSSDVDMIHAFIKPSNAVANIIGKDTMIHSSTNFQNIIQSEVNEDKIVFFVEFGCYLWNGSQNNDNIDLTEVQMLLSKLHVIEGLFFEERMDFYSYITRDPPVVETNKKHGCIPHPSFATIVPWNKASSLVEMHLNSDKRGNDETNEILMMPIIANDVLSQGHNTPLFPMSKSKDSLHVFLLFLGSVIDPLSNEMEEIRSHHKLLYEHSKSIGGKRYSYDTVTSDVKGSIAWKEHFGESVWKQIVDSKCKHDPYFLFCSRGVEMF